MRRHGSPSVLIADLRTDGYQHFRGVVLPMNYTLRSASAWHILGAMLPCSLLLSALATMHLAAMPIDLILPTGNTAIFDGSDSIFYQQTASNRPEPWNGGRFGFVRNPRRTSQGTIYTRYHEGIDIRPLYRDAAGRPLDSVVAVAQGRVVHVNDRAGQSNYGKYVVVEHVWDGSPYYSLYAHLGAVWVDSGQDLRQGDLLGRLGYTGAGINRSRAHLHFEIALMLNEKYHEWFASFHDERSNMHGAYNGRNLAGVDVARLYRALRDNPRLTMKEFLAGEQPYFEVLVPLDERPGLLRRYPWMLARGVQVSDRSWSIAFTDYGLPLQVQPTRRETSAPRAFVLEPSPLPYRWRTKSLVAGHGEEYSLSATGRQYIDMLLMETRENGTMLPATAGGNAVSDEEES